MDLTAVLLRLGAARPHVLLVPVPGAMDVRLAIEAELTHRGWPLATSPADADLLVVAGSAGPQLAAVVERTWAAVPAPRARTEISTPSRAVSALDGAAALLRDHAHQRAHPPEPHDLAPVKEAEHGGEHGGHHHHGGGMDMPGGLPMADLGEDRDGLTLDRLHVPLGPVLPDWPAGLVLRVTLQGDVIQQAHAEVLDQGDQPAAEDPGDSGRDAVRELDALARLLAVAGWADPAAQARRLRDELHAGGPVERVADRTVALLAQVRRSRTLRRLVRGVPAGPTDLATLVDRRLAAAGAAVRGVPDPAPAVAEDLAEMVVGAELAAARLIVAALDPVTGPVRHG